VKIRKNSANGTLCLQCKGVIPKGEVCVFLHTYYFWNGCRTSKLHYQCIDEFIRELKNIKKIGMTKYVFSRI